MAGQEKRAAMEAGEGLDSALQRTATQSQMCVRGVCWGLQKSKVGAAGSKQPPTGPEKSNDMDLHLTKCPLHGLGLRGTQKDQGHNHCGGLRPDNKARGGRSGKWTFQKDVGGRTNLAHW